MQPQKTEITRHMEVAIAMAYKNGSTLGKLAKKYHCDNGRIRGFVVKYGVEIRPSQSPPKYNPSEEEIRKRAEAVQETWDEDTRKRRDCYKTKPFTLPVVSTSHLVGKAVLNI